MKFSSSMTLFDAADAGGLCREALQRLFGGSVIGPCLTSGRPGTRHIRVGLIAFYGLPLPPLAPTAVPVVKLASSDANITYRGASSAGCPARPSGVFWPN